MSYVNNLCDILVNASSNHTGIVHINDGSKDNFLSYKQIYERARGVLHHIRTQGITRDNEVILQIDDNENFIYVFWACILGGIIPIPLHIGVNLEQRNQLYNIFIALKNPKIVTTHKLHAIIIDSVDSKIYGDSELFDGSKLLDELKDNLTKNTIRVEDILNVGKYDDGIRKNYIYEPQPDDIAYIQYSSGSTGCPKGITITHKNVIANVKAIANRVHIDGKDSIQNWLPITHSFALVVSHLTSMYVGINQYQMPTILFLKEPTLWFSKASQYRNTILISPNFGFHHFLGYTDKNSTYNWDLSCIKIIATGGEPIDSSICQEFENYLNGYGLNGNTIWPSYGMTEATVAIAAPRLGDQYRVLELDRDSLGYGEKVKESKGSTIKNAMKVVSVGYPYDGCFIRICNQNEELVDDKCIGSIQIKGSNVTNGYYNNEHENKDAFTKDGWLKTGDIGFLYEGELVVTGREKDIIFVNGQNYYPIDIERIVKERKELAHSEVAACGIFNREKQKEEIVIFILTKESIETFATKATSIKKYVNNCTGLEICDVIPVEYLPKASSGKIQRYKLAEQYLEGSFLDKVQSLSKATLEKTKQQLKEPRNRTEEKLVHIWSYVLKMDRIGVDQSFFELGGDSLKGAFVMNLMNSEFQLNISLQDIFRYPTIEGMSEYISNRESIAIHDIMPVEKRDYYPLSSAQKRLYALHELHKDGKAYNNTQVITINGHIEVKRVKETFTELIARHEALRTSFILQDDDIVQQIHDEVEDNFIYMEAHDEDIEKLIEQFVVPFDMQKAPLLRVCLVKINDCKYYLILDIHHIISDGISISIIMKEFLQLYRKVDIPMLKLSYKDYSVWQEKTKDSEQIKEQKAYWIKEFSSPIPLLNIPTDYRRPSKQLFEGDSVPFVIDTELTRGLKCLSRDTNTTLYMVLMSAFALFLHKYSNQDEIVVGTVTSGRNFSSLNDVVGMFVNTVAIRSHIDTEESFTNYLQRIKERSLEAFDHSEYQFEQLVEDLNMERDLSRNPIFDVMFVMENMEIPSISSEDFTWKLYDYMPKGSKMDLTLKAQERDGEIYCLLQYNTSLYKLKTMKRFIQYYSMILSAIVESSSRSISAIDMLPIEERRMIANHFNATTVNHDSNLTVYEMFKRQVERTPNRIAVVSGKDQLTYEELNRKANALARTFRDKGVKADDIVGLLVERSIYIAIGILAIMKAGGSYLPIDTEYPRERIEYLLENSKASILLLQKEMQEKVPYQYHGQMLTIDDTSSYSKDTSDLEPNSTANNIAYVIYTSGSTGQPKGVAIEHHSLVNYVTWFWNKVNLTEKDKTVLLSSYAFDLSYTSLFTSLLCGGELHILSKDEYVDPDRLLNYIKCNRITYLKMTPSLLSMLVTSHRFQALDMCGTVRLIVLGGEPINVAMIEKYHKMYPSTHIMNHYGPTECTIGCIATTIDLNHLEEYRICPAIGNPIDNMKAFLLDRNLLPVAIGQTGEIYIGGPGLARGYIGRDELNRIKFIHNPFSDDEKDRLYRTGDLGRYLEDGRIEFLGRIDNQVKIRGYRVELGEIENSIQKYPGVEKTAVIDMEDGYGNKDICAYIVAKEELSIYDLRKQLATTLPTYMLPSYFVQVNEIPLTYNGKVNREALPHPEKNCIVREEYEAASTEVERKLSNIWREVLGIDRIGINHNFFEIGGHSLKATVLLSKIQKEFHITLEMKDIFDYPSIKELSNRISSKEQSIYYRIESVGEKRYYPVSSAQKRIFTQVLVDPGSTNYNMPAAFLIEGNLDQARLQNSLSIIMNRHDVFRTTFHIVNGEMVQQVHDKIEVIITEEAMEDRSNHTVQDIAKGFVRPFHVESLPIFRFKLVNTRKDLHVLLMDMHHIIFDGVSISIFVRELNELYGGNGLNELQIQYKDYAVWQKEFLQSEGIKLQEQYWLDTFHNELPNLTLPLDYERPMIQSYEGRSIRFELGRDMTTLLREWNRSSGITLFMTLFGAYAILLSKYTTQEDIIVGTAEAGRHHSDLEGMIGMFINTLPVRTYPSESKTIMQYMEEVKATCIEVFKNSDYQFDMLLEKLDIRREMGRNPLFDTMFILENVESLAVQMDGVSLQPYELENTISKFDLMLVGEEVEDHIRFELKYSTKLFKKETIERLRDSYIQILNEIVRDQQKKIGEISYMNSMERNRILNSFNNTNLNYPKEKKISQVFEQQVRANKEKYAVVYGGNYLTYHELNQRANCIAHMLIRKGVHADSIVGIMVKRSVNMIVGILGILKAGAAYMPISEEYPESRIQFMLEDSDAIAVLTEMRLRERLGFHNHVVCIDEEALYQNDSDEPVEYRTSSKDLAYVIYTSGTTGKPKGVLIENQSVINLIHSLYERVYKKYEGDLNIALIAPYIFDASVKQIFASLLLGHTLHIIPEEARVDGEMLLNYYIKNRIDISDGTPIHLSILSKCRKEQLRQIPIRCFLIGGEALHNGVVTNFFEQCDLGKSSPDIVNVYGPTECCVDATTYLITSENCDKDIVIGKPLSNVKVYVLDGHQAIVPIGVPGELYISGDGVARGYQNSKELTQQKFMENPFEAGMRMYRTGDLVKWTNDGNIRYLGRLDHQVKIRGFRIELGEIEEQLLKQEKVKEAVVIAREDEVKRKYLCTYFTATVNISSDELRKFLSKELPDYMLPSYFVQLDQMPVTTNGKVDRNRLPEPTILNYYTEVPNDLPENEVQKILVHIWSEVLGVEKVGISNNYYSLGGDSIKAIQISAKLRDYNLKVAIRDLLQHQTIKELSPYVTNSLNEVNQDIVSGEVKLTPIQKAFFENQYSRKNYYNQSIMLFRQKGFQGSYIEKSFLAILKHHDALRMVFFEEDGNVIQMNRGEDSAGFHIDIFDVENVDSESIIRSKVKVIQSSINLETGPLVKVGLFKTNDGDHLLIVIHHLVIDGVSWRILLEDFHMAYRQLLCGEEISLPAKTDSFKEWAEILYQYANSTQLESQLSYWRTIDKQRISLLTQDAKGIGQRLRKDYATIHVCLDEEYTKKLLKETNYTYNTEINDILLTALAKTMKYCMESGKALIHLEGHGREEIHENVDVSRTIGWFTSKYPVLLDIADCHDVSSEIKNVKETLRRVPLKGIGYSILRYITLPMKRDLGIGLTVDPDICFNYLGQFDQDDKSDVFVSSSIDTGEDSSEENDIAYAISIVGMIKQNRLFITFTYHTKEFCRETMDVFSRSYLESIREVIEHCLSKQEREYTPSDFDDETLSVPELDYLNELLNEIEL